MTINISNIKDLHRHVFLLLGFISPWPIFLDAMHGNQLILFDFIYGKTAVNENGMAPYPIGVISLGLFFLICLIKSKRALIYFFDVVVWFLPFYLLFQDVGFLRVCILFAPLAFLITSKVFILVTDKNSILFIFGYLFGLIALYLSNIFSFIYMGYINNNFWDLGYGPQIFNVEIYQYLVSFSASSSLTYGCIMLILFLLPLRKNIYLLFFIIALFSSFVAIMPLRKAALLDFYFVSIIISISIIFNLLKGKIRLIFLVLVPVIFNVVLFSKFFASTREVSVSDAIETRQGPYLIAMDRLNLSDPYGLLFGFEKDFGGYSNLILELFIRSGLVGVLFYISGLIFLISRFSKNLFFDRDKREKNSLFLIIIFIIFSLIVGNMANLNLASPFFIVNLALIIILIMNIGCFFRLNKSSYGD